MKLNSLVTILVAGVGLGKNVQSATETTNFLFLITPNNLS